MALPPYLEPRDGCVWLRVKVQPRASRNEVGGVLGDALKVKVTAPPVGAAANQALVQLLAEVLQCPRGAVHLIRGQTSRQKVLQIDGLTADQIAARIPS